MVIKLWYTSKGEELSCFEGYSARGVSIITWECTLCQRSLRCSTALRMNLVGSYTHRVLRMNIVDLGTCVPWLPRCVQ